MGSLVSLIKFEFNQIGINVIGIASGKPWQDILPGCQSVIVLASGGRQLWDVFIEECQSSPQHFTNEPHPLDTFVQQALTRIDPDPPPSRRWIRCASTESKFVDFRVLGYQAGLGWQSKLGLLIHSEFGPWLGLRLACFTTEFIEPTGPLINPGPCETCNAPCLEACPGGAITRSSGWDVGVCASFHESSDRCKHTCHSRVVCPEGQQHMYDELEQHYHNDREGGRQALNRYLGLTSKNSERSPLGAGPKWKDWVS